MEITNFTVAREVLLDLTISLVLTTNAYHTLPGDVRANENDRSWNICHCHHLLALFQRHAFDWVYFNILFQSRLQTSHSHEGKQSGEPCQIYWASNAFCDSINQHCSKHFNFKKSTDTQMQKNFTVEVLRKNDSSYNLIGPYHFWVISPRNLTQFTGLLLAGRRTQCGHRTVQHCRQLHVQQ